MLIGFTNDNQPVRCDLVGGAYNVVVTPHCVRIVHVDLCRSVYTLHDVFPADVVLTTVEVICRRANEQLHG